jgi:hypothetical protein
MPTGWCNWWARTARRSLPTPTAPCSSCGTNNRWVLKCAGKAGKPAHVLLTSLHPAAVADGHDIGDVVPFGLVFGYRSECPA